MLRKISDFQKLWKNESQSTLKVLEALNDDVLSQKVAEKHRDLRRIVWHMITTLPEMGKYIGLEFSALKEDQPAPKSLSKIIAAYRKTAAELSKEIEAKYVDETLLEEDELYGLTWQRGFTLQIMINHEIHHRGQMTVLMRQAGLKVPGVCGPAYEEWENMGMKPPEV